MTAAAAARPLRSAPRILIIDDSAVARAALSRIVTESGRYSVAGAMPDVIRALALLERERVDVILLDLDMPHTNGIEGLPAIIAAAPGARVLVVSSSAADGAAITVRALALGAADTLVKPQAGIGAGRFGQMLLAKIDTLAAAPAEQPRAVTRAEPLPAFDVVAIGASTGGIHAITSLLTVLPPSLRQPILVTQHLPLAFSSYFAAQLALSGRRGCEIARDRGVIAPGHIVAAPGDAHLVVSGSADGQAVTRLSTAPSATGNLPSVDPMLESLAAVYGPRLLAVVLSGMGRDGLIGASAVHDAGGTVIVQDRATSVVWGMPGAVARAGLATAVLPPAELGALIAAGAGA